ncbi:hypothetical protein [Patulibacter minatonensis]|uniref:hypothetical protein n=1 Tax=Patulibacter minatonensis TaxID=298163 RepID=UPI00047A5F42|nr:hypothetical protein [Patulibacter minatonensis]
MTDHERRPAAVDAELRRATVSALTNLRDALDATRRRLDDEVRRLADRRPTAAGDGPDDPPARPDPAGGDGRRT